MYNFNKHNKVSPYIQSDWQAQEFEGTRRIQIMQESVIIIEETKNIDTLIIRKDVLDENLDWFRLLEKQNSPYYLTGGVDKKQKELDFLFNGLVLSLAQNAVKEHEMKMHELETPELKHRHRKKTHGIIKKCYCLLIEYPDNFNDCKIGLEKCIQDLRTLMISQYESMKFNKEKIHNIKDKQAKLIEHEENCFEIIYTSNESQNLTTKKKQ